jgi:hypothetical protein
MKVSDLYMKTISNRMAFEFVARYHYAVICPPITKISYGLFKDNKLEGVIILGYGTRPKHTIKRLFLSLDVKDYLEINRLCVLDEMPRKTESQFISLMLNRIKIDFPQIKLIFSWADGLRGKPGYIYQASNFLYGGYIWSQFYTTKSGEVIHPRLMITRFGRRDKKIQRELELTKIYGYQFRYIKFLCSKGERKRLLRESFFEWNRNYPKDKDLKFEKSAGEGSRESCQLTKLKGSGQFRNPAPDLFQEILI